MPGEQLMTALVGENRIKREVLWISVTVKRFGVNDQQMMLRLSCPAVLSAPGLAVDVTILNLSDKAEACRSEPAGLTGFDAGQQRAAADAVLACLHFKGLQLRLQPGRKGEVTV